MTWVIAIVGAFILLAVNLINDAESKNKSGNGVYYGEDANYWNENGGYQYTDLNG